VSVNYSEERKRLQEHPTQVVREYIAFLDSTNGNVRTTAMGLLRDAGRLAVPEMLSHTKESASLYVQRALFLILGDVGDQSVCKDLEGIYLSQRESMDPRTMSCLVEAMAKLGGHRYLEIFRRHLASADGNEDLQYTLAKVLAEMDDRSGTQVFLKMLKSIDPSSKRMARKYLCKLYSKDFGFDEAQWRAWIENQK